jgi:signal transduction histidine kinase
MVSATNSPARKLIKTTQALAAPLARALQRGVVPLLVLRLPELQRIAWHTGKRAAQQLERAGCAAFIDAARRLLRRGDLIAHDRQSDVFIIAMTSPSRQRRTAAPADIRAVLERISAAIALRCEVRVETGWTLLNRRDCDVDEEIVSALERGARERERYEFFSTVGHELRTPLTSIRGYLETLLDEEIDAATARRFLETARRESLRMGRLLEGMFEFSLLDLSSGAFAGHSCEIQALLQQACDVVRPFARAREISLLRAPAPEVRAAIDPDACLQLLVNLLDNAVKYGRDRGTVRVCAQCSAHGVLVSVEDDGPGIAAHERESVFGLRVRGARAGTRPGTGIGLAIVKMIAERAGGAIRVCDSSLGGARFEASLPLVEVSGVRAS